MTKIFRFTLVWLIGSFVAILMSLNTLSASLVDGHYIPVGNDSFYHARRILDTAANSQAFFEFDRKIHFPEGSQVTWPWAYDLLLAKIVSGAVALSDAAPMKVLAYIPVAAIAISTALIVAVAAALNASAFAALLAVLCVALSPLTQLLHGVGIIDHHYAEYIFMLATLWSGLCWLSQPDSCRKAAMLGMILGVAPSFHNGMFILQVPLLLTMALLWSRDRHLPFGATLALASALILTTLAVLFPSEPFQKGQFEFYLLSWFHLYVAICTAAAALMMSKLPSTLRNLIVLAAFAVGVSLPLVRQALLGGAFVAGDLDMLKNIVEVKGVWAMTQSRGLRWIVDYYSALLLLVPLVATGCGWWLLRRDSAATEVFLCISSLAGLSLLLLQFRFHPYGSHALFLPLIVAVDRLSRGETRRYLLANSALTGLLALSYVLPVKDRLFAKQEPGNDAYYGLTRQAYPLLRELCSRSPGVVLAGSDAGNYIRFHADCPVIANNFLLTPQHAVKIRELKRLLDVTPEQLLDSAPSVRYVLVTLADITTSAADERTSSRPVKVLHGPEDLKGASPALAGALLSAEPGSLGARYRLLIDYRYGEDGIPLARLYEILP